MKKIKKATWTCYQKQYNEIEESHMDLLLKKLNEKNKESHMDLIFKKKKKENKESHTGLLFKKQNKENKKMKKPTRTCCLKQKQRK